MSRPVALVKGKWDSRSTAVFPKSGDANPLYNVPFDTIDYAGIWQRVHAPLYFPSKDSGDAMMATDYTAPDLRGAKVTDAWDFWYLTADIDTGNVPKEQVVASVRAALGGPYTFVVYSSYNSWTLNEQGISKGARWAVIVPLARSYGMNAFTPVSLGFLDLLEANGLKIDDTSSSEMKRLRYLPMQGPAGYDFHAEHGQLFDGNAAMFELAKVHSERRRQEIADREARAAAYAAHGKVEGSRSIIAAYRRKHPTTPALLEFLGFNSIDGGINWHHQSQSSNSYATELFEDGALYTRSATVADMAGGLDSSGGRYFQDTYDIMKAVHYHGNAAHMEAYARQCLKEEDDAWFGPECLQLAHQLQFDEEPVSARWCQGQPLNLAARIAYAAWQQSSVSLPAPEPATPAPTLAAPAVQALPAHIIPPQAPGAPSAPEFVNLPIPQGFIGEVARWIYNEYMIDPLWDVAIISAYMLCAGVAGRKDSFKGSSCSINITLLAINGYGKDTPRSVIALFSDELANKYYAKKGTSFDHNERKNAILQAHAHAPMAPTFGTAQLIKKLLKIPSGVIVYPEAGIASKSQAGDKENLKSAIMQYTAQDAHSRGHTATVKDNENMTQPYGVTLSLFRESTKEQERQHMGEDNINSGSLARGLTLTGDVSKQPDPSRTSKATSVPKHLLEGYERLVLEAYRDEDMSLNEKSKDSEVRNEGISSVPSKHLDRQFLPEPEVEAQLQRLADERTNVRRANVENIANIQWAHNIRYTQSLNRYMLLLARTDCVVYHKPAVVTMQHFVDAAAFITEARRCELANAIDYSDDFDRLEKAMRERIMSTVYKKATDEGMKNYIRYIPQVAGSQLFFNNTHESKLARAQEALDNGRFPISFFVDGRCYKSLAALKDLKANSGGRYASTSPKDLYMQVIKNGDGTHWHFVKEPYDHVVVPDWR